MDTKQKLELIGQLVTSGAGRQRIAATLQGPLRTRRDYMSVGRKAFLVDTLVDGQTPTYDKDPNVTAYVVAEEGDNIIAVAKSKRVLFPLFEIASNPEIPLTEIKARRFDLVERSLDLAKSQIMAEEDNKVFAVLDAIATDSSTPNPDMPVVGSLTSAALADAYAAIERSDIRVAHVFMNAKDFNDLRKWDRDTLDPETQAVLLKTGLMGSVWGGKIITSRVVPEGTVYVCGEPEFLGRIPVRTEMSVLSADNPRARAIGFSIFQQIGIGAYNPYAVQRITISR